MHWQLILYCILIVAVSWLGGWIPNLVRMTHRQTQLILSLVSGVMLGVALLHLLPHSISVIGSTEVAMMTALGGLLFMFFMIRMLHFHHHDLEHHEAADCDEDNHAACDHAHQHSHGDVSWAGIAFGFSVHTVIDGIALAAAVRAEASHGVQLAGLGVFLAIALHKPLDALTITSAMAARGWPKRQRQLTNFLFSLMVPIGALGFAGGLNLLPGSQAYVLGIALAFSAGVFLCISLSDLLPEVQFHSHDRLALSGALLLGVAIAYGIELLPGHSHEHETPAVVTEDHEH